MGGSSSINTIFVKMTFFSLHTDPNMQSIQVLKVLKVLMGLICQATFFLGHFWAKKGGGPHHQKNNFSKIFQPPP